MNRVTNVELELLHQVPTTAQVLQSNPRFTHGMATGYTTGACAAALSSKYEGLSKDDWRCANDDYAVGYRMGYEEYTKRFFHE